MTRRLKTIATPLVLGVILATILILLGTYISIITAEGRSTLLQDPLTRAFTLLFLGFTSGYHLGLAIKEGKNISWFFVGLFLPLIFVSFYYACIGFNPHSIPVLLMVLGLIFTSWILNTDLISEERRIKYSVVILSRVISPGELLIVSIGDFCIPIIEMLFEEEIPAKPDLYAAIFIVYLFFIFAYELYKGVLKERYGEF